MPTETLASKRAGSRPTPPSQSLSSLSPSRNDKSKLLKATRHFLISGFWSKKIPSQDSESLEEMSLERRMSMGRRKKDRGNFWYSRGEFTQAIQNYREEEVAAAMELKICLLSKFSKVQPKPFHFHVVTSRGFGLKPLSVLFPKDCD